MTATPVIRVVDCHVARQAAAGWEYLVLRRAPNRLDAGRWRAVAGKIEPGEAAWQAALRELREETGFDAQRLLAVPYVNQFYEWQRDRINAIRSSWRSSMPLPRSPWTTNMSSGSGSPSVLRSPV